MKVIHIEISGPVQTGKSAILASVRELLESHGYCVAIPDRAQRKNPPTEIAKAAPHEKPEKDKTVIVLTEKLTPVA